MTRIERLREEVESLYKAQNPQRAVWADWLYAHHVFRVADEAKVLALRFGANAELAQAAGMLHDIADAVMVREDSRHTDKSLHMARALLEQVGFSQEEICIIVDDAIRLHSCHDGHVPQTLEGKAMATADAAVHLTTDFYDFALHALKETKSLEDIRAWALPKIERDFNAKILFSEVKEEVRARYERSKSIFQ